MRKSNASSLTGRHFRGPTTTSSDWEPFHEKFQKVGKAVGIVGVESFLF